VLCVLPHGLASSLRHEDRRFTIIEKTSPPCNHLDIGALRLPTLYFFKVAFSTFQFKFGATLLRQAERSDSEARHKAPNLT